jgi:hypothetical protein
VLCIPSGRQLTSQALSSKLLEVGDPFITVLFLQWDCN